MSAFRFMKCLLLGLLLTQLPLSGCRPESDQILRRSQLLMGTVVEISVRGPAATAEPAIEAAFREMARIEELMSPHVEGSDVWRLSRAVGQAEVAPETAEVLRLALDVEQRSEGAFDPTLGRLKELWGIETEHPRVPSETQITEALRYTGPGILQVADRRIQKSHPEVQVDLGGIAKGYAIDRAVRVLVDAGLKHASVNAGGDIRLLGDRGDRLWRVGIQHPRHPDQLLATIDLKDTAVVTSGDYERYFERDGIRYHHLFDPKTGRPARLCQAVTVVAPQAALADALATAAFVLGPERGLALIRASGAEGVLISADGKRHVTPGLEGRIAWR